MLKTCAASLPSSVNDILELSRMGTRNATAKGPVREERRNLRILVVEDNKINQAVAVRFLEKRGHAVKVADNGRQALAALEESAFDLVIMDVEMPMMDGFEATAAIRKKEEATGAHLPIVALTVHAMKGDRERCLAAGMDGYIAKPVRSQELCDTLARLLPQRSETGS